MSTRLRTQEQEQRFECVVTASSYCLRSARVDEDFTIKSRNQDIPALWVKTSRGRDEMTVDVKDLVIICAPCRGFLIQRSKEIGKRIDMSSLREILALREERARRDVERESARATAIAKADAFLDEHGEPAEPTAFATVLEGAGVGAK